MLQLLGIKRDANFADVLGSLYASELFRKVFVGTCSGILRSAMSAE